MLKNLFENMNEADSRFKIDLSYVYEIDDVEEAINVLNDNPDIYIISEGKEWYMLTFESIEANAEYINFINPIVIDEDENIKAKDLSEINSIFGIKKKQIGDFIESGIKENGNFISFISTELYWNKRRLKFFVKK
jgi:hypothetical protein